MPWDERVRPLRAALLEWLGSVGESAAHDDDPACREIIPALHRAVTALEPTAGRPLRLVLEGLTVRAVPDGGAADDCDTPEQLRAARGTESDDAG